MKNSGGAQLEDTKMLQKVSYAEALRFGKRRAHQEGMEVNTRQKIRFCRFYLSSTTHLFPVTLPKKITTPNPITREKIQAQASCTI